MQKPKCKSQKCREKWRTGGRVLAFVFCIVTLAFCILVGSICTAAEDPVSPQVEIAVSHGLNYLARQQQADGAFTGFEEPSPRAAPAAAAVLAFLSAGRTPAAGRHSLVVHNAIAFIIRQLPDDGEFGRADGSGSLGQAMITIALSQAYGVENDAALRAQIRPAIERSLKTIEKQQDRRKDPRSGGWNADARDDGQGEGDLTTTAMMALALRSLRDAGVETPADVATRAASFARACAQKDGKQNITSFAEKGQGPSPAATAAGIATLLLLDAAKPADLAQALRFLAEHRVGDEVPDFFVSLYTSTLAAKFAGDTTWSAVWKANRDVLLSRQTQDDGSWFPIRSPQVGLGTVSATAEAVMALAIPFRLLPVYGR
jgi:hypothetical protein